MLRLRHAAHQGSDRGRRLSGASAGLQGQLRPTTTKQAPWLMFQVPPWDPDEFHRNVVIPDASQSSCRFDRQSSFRYSRLRPSSEDAPSTHTLQRLRRCCRHRHGAAAGSCAGKCHSAAQAGSDPSRVLPLSMPFASFTSTSFASMPGISAVQNRGLDAGPTRYRPAGMKSALASPRERKLFRRCREAEKRPRL